MRALCAGVHVLDVLVRPVEAIPEGQDGELVEEIRITAAGSAGGTALVLAKLGAAVGSAGAIGTDAAGDMLLALLERDGVDTGLLVRQDDVQTSAGCGDAFSAGFLRGLSLGLDRRDAARLGRAAAAKVAEGLGTDYGEYDLAAVEQLAG
ncbi:MAG: carbohydrate kinase family protein [Thermoleophilaceae bacterium]